VGVLQQVEAVLLTIRISKSDGVVNSFTFADGKGGLHLAENSPALVEHEVNDKAVLNRACQLYKTVLYHVFYYVYKTVFYISGVLKQGVT